MGTAWKMPIAVIGKPTGDGRQFDAGALTHRKLPLPLRYVASDSGGHSNAVIVGHIAKIGKEQGGLLPAQGEFYDDDAWPDDVREAATAARMFTQKKVIGPSVDLDQMEAEHVPEPKAYAAWKKEQAGKLKAAKMAHGAKTGGDCGCGGPVMAEEAFDGPRLRMIRSGRLASATLVHIPAFAELAGHAKLTPIDSSDPNVDGTTSSVMVAGAMVTFDWADVDWNAKIENDGEFGAAQDECADEAADTVIPNRKTKKKPNVDGSQDTQEMADSGIWLSDAEFEEFAKRRLPSKTKQGHAGEPDYPTGDSEGQGGASWAAADVTKAGVRNKLAPEDFVDPDGRRFPIASCGDIADAVSSYGRANPKIPYGTFKSRLTAIAKRKGCSDSLPDNWKAGEKMAALMASVAAPAAPPKEWFDDPKLSGPTPLHIGDDGKVYGHVAVWDTCHVGIGDSCVIPPKSQTSYAYFHTGEVVTADGSRLPVGRLSYGGGHAQPRLGFRAAVDHYDQTSTMGATVRAGEDAYGIWVAGALVPEADEKAVRTMRATPLSGDWRRIGTNLEMVAALHVNTAGFPIPRTMTAGAEEQVLSMVAAGALAVIDEADTVTAGVDTEALGRAIARGMIAEQQEAAFRAEREGTWRELVAAATADGRQAEYDEALSGLMVALIE